MKKLLLLTACLFLTLSFSSCESEDKEEDTPPVDEVPNTCLLDNDIIITNIADIPDNITFNKVRAEVSGVDWGIIDVVESVYDDGKIVLSLPTSFAAEKLQKVVRSNRTDYTGFWFAATDNEDARVAALGDIFVYDNDVRAGMLSLTDWAGDGSTIGKSWVYYHYTNQPFALSKYIKKSPDDDDRHSYTYRDASFEEGWNAYANTNQSESSAGNSMLCTTAIDKDKALVWRFKALH